MHKRGIYSKLQVVPLTIGHVIFLSLVSISYRGNLRDAMVSGKGIEMFNRFFLVLCWVTSYAHLIFLFSYLDSFDFN